MIVSRHEISVLPMELDSVRAVIAALGGIRAVSEMTGRDYRTVSAWQARLHCFPPQFYVAMRAALAVQGNTAPHRLWQMVELEDAQTP